MPKLCACPAKHSQGVLTGWSVCAGQAVQDAAYDTALSKLETLGQLLGDWVAAIQQAKVDATNPVEAEVRASLARRATSVAVHVASGGAGDGGA